MKAGAAPGDIPIPDMSHILGVTSLVMEAGGDEDEVIAALLHDLPEDHGGQVRLDEICEQFGGRVAGMVAFHHCGRVWSADGDTRFGPLEIAYAAIQAAPTADPLEVKVTNKGKRLKLVRRPDLQATRGTRAAHLYMYATRD